MKHPGNMTAAELVAALREFSGGNLVTEAARRIELAHAAPHGSAAREALDGPMTDAVRNALAQAAYWQRAAEEACDSLAAIADHHECSEDVCYTCGLPKKAREMLVSLGVG